MLTNPGKGQLRILEGDPVKRKVKPWVNFGNISPKNGEKIAILTQNAAMHVFFNKIAIFSQKIVENHQN
jgi:hypothetical protein